jgi:8-oxo-dGTP pyrophosphatase MutT (NUDIX family)
VIESGDTVASWKKFVDTTSFPEIQSLLSEFKDEGEFQRRVASVREVFEETNVLLASCESSFSHKIMPKEEKEDADWFAKFCAQHKAVPALSSLKPFARWVTPAIMKARFDTVFYLAPVQNSQLEHMDCNPGEIDSLDWISPDEALNLYESGKLQLAPPTFLKLKEMRLCTDYDALLDPPSKSVPEPIIPVALKDESSGSISIAFPGDKDHPSSKDPHNTALRRMVSPGPKQQWIESSSGFPLLSNVRITYNKL